MLIALAALGGGSCVGASAIPMSLPVRIGVTLFVSWQIFWKAFRNGWGSVPALEPVRASAAGLTIGGRFIPRARIERGVIVPGSPPSVLLHDRLGAPITITGSRDWDADGLLRALGLDASQDVATFSVHAPVLLPLRLLRTAGFFAAAIVLALEVTVPSAWLVAVGVVWCLTWALLARRTRLRVAADGLLLDRLWSKRFLGYREIAAVTRPRRTAAGRVVIALAYDEHVAPIAIELRSGEVLRMNVDTATVAALEARIRGAMASHDEGGAAAATAALRRRGRSAKAWMAALRALGERGTAVMRTAPVRQETLLRIAEDPSSSTSDRAAATLALAGDLDEAGRARLRAAARMTAAPRLRVAIERVVDGAEDAEIEAALAALEEEQERSAGGARRGSESP